MSKIRKRSSGYARIVNFFKNKAIRNLTIIFFMLFSLVCMFFFDESNFIRNKIEFFNEDNNYILKLLTLIGLDTSNGNLFQNISIGAWLLYFCCFFLCALYVFGNIYHKKFVTNKAKDNIDAFKNYRRARNYYAFGFYGILTLIGAVIIFAAYMFGAFTTINDNTTQNIFYNLAYTLLVAFIFFASIPLALIIIYLILKLIFRILGLLISLVARPTRDILISSDYSDMQAQRALDEARKFAGINKISTSVVTNMTSVKPIYSTERKEVFPELVQIDAFDFEDKINSTEISLNDLALRFQAYCANKHSIYYELPLIRAYIAGLASSRLIILEGLSGTGKSMLPRMFSEFTNSKAFFTPVQATWRDKTDLLGFFSEFTGTYKSTDFLNKLYSASYSRKINQLVLDEINISRVEYYFADFLSVLEYPEEDWRIKIYSPELGESLPRQLDGGFVKVQNNTWFIGTANTDDSTFTITDKVYDRAIVIDFKEKASPIQTDADSEPIELSSDALKQLFKDACENEQCKLSSDDIDNFLKVCDFTKDAFDIRFGNRIMTQIESFVPVYVALGGTKEEALDFMFARKILHKLEGSYEDYIKDELIKLTKLIDELYGKDSFAETKRLIAKITKRLV